MSDLSSLQNLCGSHWKSRSTVGFCGKCHNPKIIDNSQALTGPRIFPLLSLFFGAAFRPFYQLPRPSPTYWTCWNQPNRSSGSPSQHRLVGCTTHLVRCFMFGSLGFGDPKVINFALQSQNHPSHNPTNASADEFFLKGGKFGMHPRKQIFVNQPIHHEKYEKQKTSDKHWINPKAARAREGSASLPRRRREEKHLSRKKIALTLWNHGTSLYFCCILKTRTKEPGGSSFRLTISSSSSSNSDNTWRNIRNSTAVSTLTRLFQMQTDFHRVYMKIFVNLVFRFLLKTPWIFELSSCLFRLLCPWHATRVKEYQSFRSSLCPRPGQFHGFHSDDLRELVNSSILEANFPSGKVVMTFFQNMSKNC